MKLRIVAVSAIAAVLVAGCSNSHALDNALTINAVAYARDVPMPPLVDDNGVTIKGDLENTYTSVDAPCVSSNFSLVGAGRTLTPKNASCESTTIAPNTRGRFEATFPLDGPPGVYTLRYRVDNDRYATRTVALGVPTELTDGPIDDTNAASAIFFGYVPGTFTAWIARQSAIRCFPYVMTGVNRDSPPVGQSYHYARAYGIDYSDFPTVNPPEHQDDTYGPQGPDAPSVAGFSVRYDRAQHRAYGVFSWGDDYANIIMMANVPPPSPTNDGFDMPSDDLSGVDAYRGTALLGASRTTIQRLFGPATLTAPCEGLTATTYAHHSPTGQANTFATFVFRENRVIAFAYDGV